ncbi:MAG: hypothetical protein WCK02_17390 [Bacteroidota bacterium]
MKTIILLIFSVFIFSSCVDLPKSDKKDSDTLTILSDSSVLGSNSLNVTVDTQTLIRRKVQPFITVKRDERLIGKYVDSINNISFYYSNIVCRDTAFVYSYSFLVNKIDSSFYVTLDKETELDFARNKNKSKIVDALRIRGINYKQFLQSTRSYCTNGDYFPIVTNVISYDKLTIYKVYQFDCEEEKILEVDKWKLECEYNDTED